MIRRENAYLENALHRDLAGTQQQLDDTLTVARAMLAALIHAREEIHHPGAYRNYHDNDISDRLDAAIDAARAAGIATE